MMVRSVILMLALALPAAAGCGGDEAGTGGGGALPAPIVFQVGGGEAPRLDRLTVQPDGSAQLKTMQGEKPVRLTDNELSKLAEQIEDADLPGVPEDSLSPEPIPDAPGYRFIYQSRQIDTDAAAAPEGIEPLISNFLELIDRYGAK